VSSAASEIRSFLSRLDPVWQRVVVDPEQFDSDESWEIPDTVPEVCNNLLVVSALVLLAYYEHVTRRMKREPRSPYLDRQLSHLLSDASDPMRMTGAQALTTLEWALESDVIPLVNRESLKTRHVMFLNVIARERYDPHHRDYHRFVSESLRAPVPELVRQIIRAIAFLEEIEPQISGSAYATYASGKGRQRALVRFPLGPFFVNPRQGEMLPFWKFDPREQKYVYQSLWSNQEYRRPKPARAEMAKGQRMVTALLSSSFRPLAELARIASWHLHKHGPSLRNVLSSDSPKVTLSAEEFSKDPLMSTWRLITELGPIGLLERDDALAEEVFRQVHAEDDDQAIREMELKAGKNPPRFKRLLALEAARLLGLDVHSLDDSGQLEVLWPRIGSDLEELQGTDDAAIDKYACERVVWWANTVESELRFLTVFYASLPFRRDGEANRMTREDVKEIFDDPTPGIHALWNRFKRHVLENNGVCAALREVTGRSAPDDGLDEDEREKLKGLIDKIARLRNKIVHAPENSSSKERPDVEVIRGETKEYLEAVMNLVEMLRGQRAPVRPIYPYLLTFKTAVYTSGGLTTLQYSSHLGAAAGGHGVVVYTSRHIDLARAYYCLPRIGQSELATDDKKRDRRSVLVDPLLIDADAVGRLVQYSMENR